MFQKTYLITTNCQKKSEIPLFWQICIHFCPILQPCRSLIQCQIWLILFFLFASHHIVMSSKKKSFTITYLNEFHEPNILKNFNFGTFLPYFRPCRPLIWYQISVNFCYLFKIHYIFMSSYINHSQ